jgi:hypothetical protein
MRCGSYHRRIRPICPIQGVAESPSSAMLAQNSAQCGAVAGGTQTPLSALSVKLLSDSRAITFRARLGPMPGRSCSIRNPATASLGFSAQRKTHRASFICAASRNFRPPYFTNGMFRRASSISSAALWCAVRNRTACRFRSMPDSRCSRTPLTTY